MKKISLILLLFLSIGFLQAQEDDAKAQRIRSMKLKYHNHLGNLWMNANSFRFNPLHVGKIQHDTIKFFNNMDEPLSFKYQDNYPYFKFQSIPEIVPPSEEGIMIMTADGNKLQDYGRIFKRINLKTNDSVAPMKRIGVSLYITEDFSKWTPEQWEKAPAIAFETSSHDFGQAKSGDVLKTRFNFTNKGQTDLIIRNVKGS